MALNRIILAFVCVAAASGCTGVTLKDPNKLEVHISDQKSNNNWIGDRLTFVAVKIGNPIELQYAEEIEWSLIVNANSIKGFGNTINFNGITVKETTRSKRTKIWTAETSAASRLLNPVTFTVVGLSNPPTVAVITILN